MANSISVGNVGLPKGTDDIDFRRRLDDFRKKGIIEYSEEKFAATQNGRYWNDAFHLSENEEGPNRLKALHDKGDCQITVRSYAEWLNTKSFWRFPGRLIGFFNYSFPQMSTADQNMAHPDKPAALLSLGYLQGLQLNKMLKQKQIAN